MSRFEIPQNETVLRIDASGTWYVLPEQQNGLDRMLSPLGQLTVIACPHCGNPAHADFLPVESVFRVISSNWHCHGCGCLVRQYIGVYDHKLPDKNYHVPGVASAN